MIRTLKLKGYRGFDSYELDGLTRINLLVGKNNCGKTSLLESINLLVSGGDPIVLEQSASRRGEINLLADSDLTVRRDNTLDISHLFLGHSLSPGVSFLLSSENNNESVSVEILDMEELNVDAQRDLFEDEMDSTQTLCLEISRNERDKYPLIPVNDDGSVVIPRYSRSRQRWQKDSPVTPSVQFLAPDSLYPGSMREMWDKVLVEGRESDVIAAMKILDQDIESIHFLTGHYPRMFSDKTGVVVGFRHDTRRLPLGSHGDGMRRLLALSLSLIRTTNGVLLIDEIDTGLHWSIMKEMWRLIVNTACMTNVQVFATTHSYDCIKGFASLVESCPEFAQEISIQKIDRSLEQAVNLDAEKIQIAVGQDIEVR